jgi:hypothetical protein
VPVITPLHDAAIRENPPNALHQMAELECQNRHLRPIWTSMRRGGGGVIHHHQADRYQEAPAVMPRVPP